jgi:hypothetical protein
MPRNDTDWLLAGLLDHVSRTGDQLPLTLFCDGLVVSGTAISEEDFFLRFSGGRFSDLGRQAAERREGTDRKMDALLARAEAVGVSDEERELLTEQMDNLRRLYIIMRDVTIIGPSPPRIKAPVWRGRLSKVSGWILGSIDEVAETSQ